ncbi:MAG: HAMP domain-containing protein [Chloroflexi bacterium]|nr:HAMP domain-containing protein [Chloroflexota bacterium]
MFHTLRSKLIFSYAAIAVLSLLLTLVGTLGLARDAAERNGYRTLNQKKELALPFIKIVVAEQRRYVPQATLAGVTKTIQNAGLRIMLLDPKTLKLQEDTGAANSNKPEAAGTMPLNFTKGDLRAQKLLGQKDEAVQGTFRFDGESQTYQYVAQRIVVSSLRNSVLGNAATSGTPRAQTGGELVPPAVFVVVLAQPGPQLLNGTGNGGLSELVGLVLASVGIALLVSLIVAYILSGSISRPVARLAGAAAAMARGDYSYRLPVRGRDELSTLTGEFNSMAAEVGRAHQMQRDFTANVSHDLKTPLTSIQGFSQAMLDGAIRDEAGYRQAAAIINTEAQRMSRLVNQLLNLSHLQNGLMALEMQPTQPGQIITQLVLAMQPQAQEAGIALGVHSQSAGSVVLADVDRLKQALSNLIDNAIKYTPRGGKVTLGLRDVADGVEISVADTGAGIPPEELNRVMERFYQVDKSRSSAQGRSIGLGLAIAREIIHAHNGQLKVESALDAGTTVRIVLPASASHLSPVTRSLMPRLTRKPKTQELEPANRK